MARAIENDEKKPTAQIAERINFQLKEWEDGMKKNITADDMAEVERF
jgi:hypothetical protein